MYAYVWLVLLCLPEVSTTVLIGYKPILNKKLNKIHHVQVPETYRKKSHKQLDRYTMLIWDKYYAISIWKKDSSISGNFINEHRAGKN